MTVKLALQPAVTEEQGGGGDANPDTLLTRLAFNSSPPTLSEVALCSLSSFQTELVH